MLRAEHALSTLPCRPAAPPPPCPACRLQGYGSNLEEDVKLLQGRDLTPEQRLAAQLRVAEKRILSGTMGGVRRRLAPIRGIPTKVS